MAVDLRTVRNFPAFRNFTGAVTWTEVKLPENCSRVQIGCDAAKLYVSDVGTDGGAVTPASDDLGFIPQNNYLTFHLGRGSTKQDIIYIAATTGTPQISILLEEL